MGARRSVVCLPSIRVNCCQSTIRILSQFVLDGSAWCGNTADSRSWRTCDGLDECLFANAVNRAYVELFFHDNQSAVNWFQGSGSEGSGGVNESWRYGWAVDGQLGYPR